MASRVVLHIGQQKSGTTYLQGVLQGCAERLAGAGVLYPLPAGRRRRAVEGHERATRGVVGEEYPWVSRREAARMRGEWDRLRREVRAWPGAAVLSAEALSVVRTAAIHRLLDDLDARDVAVVVTARSLGRSVPSLWQQHVRNGRRTSFETYLADLAAQRERPAEDIEAERGLYVWRSFALGGLLRRWAAVVGPERVRLVVAPHSPPRLLWSRFASAAGLAELADTVPAERLGTRTHAGLTAPEALAMLSLNAALADAGLRPGAANRVRTIVITHGFTQRADRGPGITIPPPWRERVARWSRTDLAELAESGVAAVGDTAGLRYEPDRDTAPAPTLEQVREANAAAMYAIVRRRAPLAGSPDGELPARAARALRRRARTFLRVPG